MVRVWGYFGMLHPRKGVPTKARALTGLAGAVLVLTAATPGAYGLSKVGPASPALSIANESRSQVVTLHDLAVSVIRPKGIPANVISGSAQRLGASFLSEATACSAIGGGAQSPAGELAVSLRSYGSLAGEVASGARKGSVPANFATTLRLNDKIWLKALSSLDKADHVNLLSGVPALLYTAGAG